MVNENKRGKVIAFWIDKKNLKKINKLIEQKKAKNRSAIINMALEKFLKKGGKIS